MYLAIISILTLATIGSGLFGRFLGHRGVGFFNTFCLFFVCFLSWVMFFEVGVSNSPVFVELGPIFTSGLFQLTCSFLFDSVTVTLLVLVSTVSSLVHLYSLEYMSEDPHLPRFLTYLTLFTFFMVFLVTAGNFIQLFVG